MLLRMEALGLSFTPVTPNCFVDQTGRTVNYSDGSAEESRLLDIVGSIEDLSSMSWQLHNSARNHGWNDIISRFIVGRLSDALPLTGNLRVLEIGGGDGAITRALGEQVLWVDAIEGSIDRARICASRCRNLPNVRVFAADINRITPEPTYDLVFLIGVLEWSRGFIEGN